MYILLDHLSKLACKQCQTECIHTRILPTLVHMDFTSMHAQEFYQQACTRILPARVHNFTSTRTQELY